MPCHKFLLMNSQLPFESALNEMHRECFLSAEKTLVRQENFAFEKLTSES